MAGKRPNPAALPCHQGDGIKGAQLGCGALVPCHVMGPTEPGSQEVLKKCLNEWINGGMDGWITDGWCCVGARETWAVVQAVFLIGCVSWRTSFFLGEPFATCKMKKI